jgi:hypothetical protein
VKKIATLLLLVCLTTPSFAGVGSHNAMFVGGTVTTIKAGSEGKVSTDDEKIYVFTYKEGSLSIPYDRVEALEYGQKAGRRIGLAIAISPWLLLSKKRSHFLTLGKMMRTRIRPWFLNLAKILSGSSSRRWRPEPGERLNTRMTRRENPERAIRCSARTSLYCS